MEAEFLKRLGFTKSQIQVYISLLRLNSSSASALADETGMYRKNVYDALYALVKKGLVSFAKTDRGRVFTAASPQRLLELIEMQKSDAEVVLKKLRTIYDASPIREDITIFQGKEGLKTIFEDIISLELPYDIFGSVEEFRKLLPYHFSQYQKRKAGTARRCRAVCPYNERKSAFAEEFKGRIRFLLSGASGTTIIYGTKVSIIMWEATPTGIVISNEHLAKSYSQYFEALWRAAAK